MKSKPDSIDLIQLYSTCNYKQWNTYLTKCYKTQNIQELLSARRRLQAGMSDLEKRKLNVEKICVLYIRLLRSIEKTLQRIYRDKNPNPLYNPANKDMTKYSADKKRKDVEFHNILKREGY